MKNFFQRLQARREREHTGIVQARKNRQTGTTILVVDGEKYGVDTDDGAMPYSTICEAHGSIITHRTLALARAHAADPLGWCEPCAVLKSGKCDECGMTPGPKPAAKYTETAKVPGTCTFCNLSYGAPEK